MALFLFANHCKATIYLVLKKIASGHWGKFMSKKKSENQRHVGIRLDESDYEVLRVMAEQDSRPMSNFLLLLIREEAERRGLRNSR